MKIIPTTVVEYPDKGRYKYAVGKQTFEDELRSEGRNGLALTTGLEIWPNEHRPVITLSPVNSRGNRQRGHIELPRDYRTVKAICDVLLAAVQQKA